MHLDSQGRAGRLAGHQIGRWCLQIPILLWAPSQGHGFDRPEEAEARQTSRRSQAAVGAAMVNDQGLRCRSLPSHKISAH